MYANLVILATRQVFYWSPWVSLGHLGGLVEITNQFSFVYTIVKSLYIKKIDD